MKVSVIIPCFNEETFVGQAIGSLLEQTRPPEEIIIVDDGSTDRSAEVAGSFGDLVRVLNTDGHGAPRARNYGADNASGDALMFLDADDILGPNVIEILTEHLKINPAGIVACPWYRLDKIKGKWVRRPRSCQPLVAEQDYLSGWLTGKYHPPCSVLWSRTAFKKTGGWDPEVIVNQDGDLMMRALIDGIVLKITEDGEAFYRRLPKNTQFVSQSSKQSGRSGRKSQIYVLRKVAYLLDKRSLLSNYRKPLTEALLGMKSLCHDIYPELVEECNQLLDEYGEPKSIQIIRVFIKQVKRKYLIGLNRGAARLSHIGLKRVRDSLAQLKKIIWENKAGNNEQVVKEIEKLEEIKYGLHMYHKMMNNRKS